ncbi:MAG: metallophosphoesterase [Minwuia sp.]|uniref:metallophosphoesterase n=1 Tax=Minwuia sp. TaxID=2493630 RepID=UPI003A89E418
MKTLILPVLAAMTVWLSAAAAEPFRFVAMGDLPYNLPGDYEKFDRLIGRINDRQPAFSVHVGDIKSGGSECSDAAFEKIHRQFMSFDQPLFYTPGDNEWTDCHREAAGGYDPLERLSALRRMFFAEAKSLGRTSRPYRRQADTPVGDGLIENAVWRQDDVLFVTAHVVGSNNGMERNATSVEEFLRRDAANLAWLAAAFREAQDMKAGAMVVIFHANPMFEVEKSWDYSNSGFKTTIAALAEGAAAFGKPVLLVHGDFHEFIIDKPLRGGDGKLLRNVTRLQVMGARDVGGVEVSVDTATEAVFGFTPILVE